MIEVVRTLRVPLDPTQEQDLAMRKTEKLFQDSCNYVSEFIFNNGFPLSSSSVQKIVYRDLRSKLQMKSQMAITSIKTAVARYKTIRAQMRSKKVQSGWTKTGKPVYSKKSLEYLVRPVQFKNQQVILQRARDYSLASDNRISIGTSEGRIAVHIKPSRINYWEILANADLGGRPHWRDVENDGTSSWPTRASLKSLMSPLRWWGSIGD